MSGSLKQISLSNGHWGGVQDDGNIYMAPANTNQWKLKSGKAKYLTLDGGRACVIGIVGGEIFCADDAVNPDWKRMSGAAVMVELSGDNLVCVNSGGDVFRGKYKTGEWQKIGTGCIHADIVGNTIYAITKSNDIYVFGASPAVVAPAPPVVVAPPSVAPPPVAPLVAKQTEPVVKPAEGQAVKCSKNSPVAGGVFRYEGGKLRHYPNPPIAASWDPEWAKPLAIDCTGVPSGLAMSMKNLAPPVAPITVPTPSFCPSPPNPNTRNGRASSRCKCGETCNQGGIGDVRGAYLQHTHGSFTKWSI